MKLVKELVVVAAVSIAGSAATQAVGGTWGASLVVGLLAAVLMIGAYTWIVRRVEDRAPAEVAPSLAPRALGRGFALGILLFAGVIGVIALLGGYRVAGWGSPTAFLGLVGLMAAVAVSEELIFRGLLFRRLERRAGTWIALVVTAAPFGALHLVNPSATLWGATAIAIEAGLMLGAAYAATRTLWLPIGLHFGWNLAAAGIFGTEVSGGGVAQGLLDGVTSGPIVLSGGAFGPEASLVAVIAGVILTGVFLRLAHRRGRFVPRPRRAETPEAPAPATATVAR